MKNVNKQMVLLEISQLDKTTPYMLRNDGMLFTCGETHPYIKQKYKQPIEETIEYINKFPNNLTWFKDNSLVPETVSLCAKLLKTSDKSAKDVEKIIELTNQEFCRVRTSNFKYKYGGDNGEIYFRISSVGFNWFNLIWDVVNRFKQQIKFVTIMRDYAACGKQFDYIKDGKYEFNKMPIEEFLTLPGNPVVEDLEIEEDIEKHDELNPKLFENNKMIPEVREKLLTVANEFLENLAEDNIPINVKDIQIVGSNASYNYTKDSDIDLHIIVDMSELNDPDGIYPALYNAYKTLWNNKYDITTHEIPTEIYIEPNEASNVSNGCYSVQNDEWIREPKHEAIPDLDQEAFNVEFSKWEDRYNKIMSEEELEEEIHTPKIDEITSFIQDLYDMRKASLASEGEYSIGNLVFKEVRNRGYLDWLKELKAELIGKELSLENLQEDTVKQNGKWVNKGDSGETHGEFKTKKAADAQRKAMYANGYKEELELDERLDEKQRREYREEIGRISFNQAIIQDNGLFNIYNVKENDVNRIINRLRDLDYIDWVNKNAGRYDFSQVAIFGQPQARYYNITGKIKN